MSLTSIVGWIVCGLIVGLLARALIPGEQRMGLIQTSVLGIVGALVGGYLYALWKGEPVATLSLTGNNWYGWGVAILGATLVILLWTMASTRRARI